MQFLKQSINFNGMRLKRQAFTNINTLNPLFLVIFVSYTLYMDIQEILIKAAQLIASLAFLVTIHEFGHFIPARLFKTKVEKFYLFFNPWFSLFRYRKVNGKKRYALLKKPQKIGKMGVIKQSGELGGYHLEGM
jgi:Zn-dependent protease